MSTSLENPQYKTQATLLGVELKTHVLNETTLAEVMAGLYDRIQAILKTKKEHDVAGAYGIAYAELCACAADLVQECEVAAHVVYLYFAPVIRTMRETLQSPHTVMPLGEFENYMKSLGWKPDPIYITTG